MYSIRETKKDWKEIKPRGIHKLKGQVIAQKSNIKQKTIF